MGKSLSKTLEKAREMKGKIHYPLIVSNGVTRWREFVDGRCGPNSSVWEIQVPFLLQKKHNLTTPLKLPKYTLSSASQSSPETFAGYSPYLAQIWIKTAQSWKESGNLSETHQSPLASLAKPARIWKSCLVDICKKIIALEFDYYLLTAFFVSLFTILFILVNLQVEKSLARNTT